MAEILVKGSSKELRQDELRIEFPHSPSFRGNHNILTPSVIGTIIGYGIKPMYGFLPCPDEEAALLLADTTVTLRRLARFEKDSWYGDVRDDDEFWPAMPPSYRPAVNAKAYDLPHGGPNTDAATIRTLIVKDFTRASHDLIADFEYGQQDPTEQVVKRVGSGDNPYIDTVLFAQDLDAIIGANPAALLQDVERLHKFLDPVFKKLRLLDHLRTMHPLAQRQAVNLPADKVWAAIELFMKRRPDFAGRSDLDDDVSSVGV